MRTYDSISLAIPEILLPRPGVDLTKWAVIACDQHTSEPAYWQAVDALVGEAPSTLRLIYPEVYLAEADPLARILSIREAMQRYVAEGLFQKSDGLLYVERQVGHGTRRGVMACLDLERYEFHKGSTSPIRATEGTILERIPPRVRIREGAALELPHIMVLLDDPADTVLGPLAAARARLPLAYDVELMLGAGRVSGHHVTEPALEAGVVRALEALARPAVPGQPVLLYAVGDGNHSLATAKSIWELTKAAAPDPAALAGSPLRHALVELVNLHDPSLVFEPIHRVLFHVAPDRELLAALGAHAQGRCRFAPVDDFDALRAAVDEQPAGVHRVGLVRAGEHLVVEIAEPSHNLPVGTLQAFLDAFLQAGGAKEVDYVHGTEPVRTLGASPGNAGFYLPAMRKESLFQTVVLDGALPRKTFSMGEAWEKRFYLEARALA